MKVYTKTGDKGQTSLLGGERVSKDHLQIEAYGTIDELNSYIGLIRDLCPEEVLLMEIQTQLFTCGSHLASSSNSKFNLPNIDESLIASLEKRIDEMEEKLIPLKNFVLPGGHSTVSFIHITRCVCRRAERAVVRLNDINQNTSTIITLLNRLSDYFFVLSRKISDQYGVEELLWKSGK